jgi:hypothetical protein
MLMIKFVIDERKMNDEWWMMNDEDLLHVDDKIYDGW